MNVPGRTSALFKMGLTAVVQVTMTSLFRAEAESRETGVTSIPSVPSVLTAKAFAFSGSTS